MSPKNIFAKSGSALQSALTGATIAEVIYQATTGDHNQLRYISDSVAEALISKRTAKDESQFLDFISDLYNDKP